MYAICETMKWRLPVAGGIYDQDPELLDFWYIIISEKAKADKAERDSQNKKSGKGKGGMLGSGGPRNVRGPKVAGRFN
jgi:hypothetical protein